MNLPKPQNAPSVESSEVLRALLLQQGDFERRGQDAQAKAAQAYSRLLKIAEESDTGQASRVARFVASTFNGAAFRFDLFDLRAVDVEISDDMILCIDALRWGKADLYRLVPDGEARIKRMIGLWNFSVSSKGGV